jgi:hypothetical protein
MLVDETGPWISLGNLVTSPWHEVSYDLTAWAGHMVRLRFEYWTGDSWSNDYIGWFLDDVRIESTSDAATAFCSGDGSGGHCPCSNVGGPGRGCPSSFNAQGALLAGSGNPSFTNDTLALTASDVSQSMVTFFAGPTRLADGFSGVFGDGRRCVTGSLVRARAFPNPAGVAQIPLVGNPSLGAAFNVTPASPTRYVQAMYRNVAPFCTTATYNVTNGVIVTWRP